MKSTSARSGYITRCPPQQDHHPNNLNYGRNTTPGNIVNHDEINDVNHSHYHHSPNISRYHYDNNNTISVNPAGNSNSYNVNPNYNNHVNQSYSNPIGINRNSSGHLYNSHHSFHQQQHLHYGSQPSQASLSSSPSQLHYHPQQPPSSSSTFSHHHHYNSYHSSQYNQQQQQQPLSQSPSSSHIQHLHHHHPSSSHSLHHSTPTTNRKNDLKVVEVTARPTTLNTSVSHHIVPHKNLKPITITSLDDGSIELEVSCGSDNLTLGQKGHHYHEENNNNGLTTTTTTSTSSSSITTTTSTSTGVRTHLSYQPTTQKVTTSVENKNVDHPMPSSASSPSITSIIPPSPPQPQSQPPQQSQTSSASSPSSSQPQLPQSQSQPSQQSGSRRTSDSYTNNKSTSTTTNRNLHSSSSGSGNSSSSNNISTGNNDDNGIPNCKSQDASPLPQKKVFTSSLYLIPKPMTNSGQRQYSTSSTSNSNVNSPTTNHPPSLFPGQLQSVSPSPSLNNNNNSSPTSSNNNSVPTTPPREYPSTTINDLEDNVTIRRDWNPSSSTVQQQQQPNITPLHSTLGQAPYQRVNPYANGPMPSSSVQPPPTPSSSLNPMANNITSTNNINSNSSNSNINAGNNATLNNNIGVSNSNGNTNYALPRCGSYHEGRRSPPRSRSHTFNSATANMANRTSSPDRHYTNNYSSSGASSQGINPIYDNTGSSPLPSAGYPSSHRLSQQQPSQQQQQGQQLPSTSSVSSSSSLHLELNHHHDYISPLSSPDMDVLTSYQQQQQQQSLSLTASQPASSSSLQPLQPQQQPSQLHREDLDHSIDSPSNSRKALLATCQLNKSTPSLLEEFGLNSNDEKTTRDDLFVEGRSQFHLGMEASIYGSDSSLNKSSTSSVMAYEPTAQLLARKGPTFAEAMFDHVSYEEDELKFLVGDIILILDANDEDWWYGKLITDDEDQVEGWFPSSFVRLRVAQETAAEEVAEKQRKTSVSSDKGVEKLAYIRGRVIDELLQTEKDFVGYLKFIIQDVLYEAKAHPNMFSEEQIKTIFGNLENLFILQKDFLKDLEISVLKNDNISSRIGKCFLDYGDRFGIYTEYCGNHPNACAEIRRLCTNLKYQRFFELCCKLHPLGTLGMDGFLVMPVQRICKYHLQLAELLKHTSPTSSEYSIVKAAHQCMKGVASKINEQKRLIENIAQIANWQKSIEAWEGDNVAMKSIKLIYSGPVRLLSKGKVKDRMFFLFDRQLICCKKDGGGLTKGNLVYKGRYDLEEYDIIPLETFEEEILESEGWKVRCKDDVFIYGTATVERKKEWGDAFIREREEVESMEDLEIPEDIRRALIIASTKTEKKKPLSTRLKLSRTNTERILRDFNDDSEVFTRQRLNTISGPVIDIRSKAMQNKKAGRWTKFAFLNRKKKSEENDYC